jgi:hypothetical protein
MQVAVTNADTVLEDLVGRLVEPDRLKYRLLETERDDLRTGATAARVAQAKDRFTSRQKAYDDKVAAFNATGRLFGAIQAFVRSTDAGTILPILLTRGKPKSPRDSRTDLSACAPALSPSRRNSPR